MQGYQKKGLLDIIDRESSHYNKSVTKPPIQQSVGSSIQTKQRVTKKARNEIPPLQSSTVTEDYLMESKRVISAKKQVLNRDLKKQSFSTTQLLPPTASSLERDFTLIKQPSFDGMGMKAFTSVNEISRYLDNPQLLNLKNQPNRLLDPQNSNQTAGLWRNAFYLSTSIDDANVRKMPPKSVSEIQSPMQSRQFENYNSSIPNLARMNERNDKGSN